MDKETRMKRPWNVIGAGFNDKGVSFTFEDSVINRSDIKLMEAAPDLLEVLQELVQMIDAGGWDNATTKARATIAIALGEE